MDDKPRYSASDIARILTEEGDSEISTRTVNYYAFEKGMFEIKEQGKNCFTDEELDKVRAIRLLKHHTNFTLEQMKKIINSHPLEEVKRLCMERAMKITEDKSYSTSDKWSDNINSVSAPVVNASLPVLEPAVKLGKHSTRTIKVDDDVTLILGPKVSIEKLKKIIDFIKSL